MYKYIPFALEFIIYLLYLYPYKFRQNVTYLKILYFIFHLQYLHFFRFLIYFINHWNHINLIMCHR